MTPKPANKQTVAIDVDEVLASNAEGFVAFSNKQYGTNLRVEDYSEHWGELWQVNDEEAERRAVQYHQSGTHSKLKAIQEAKEVLTGLSKNYKLVVLTSRRVIIEEETRQWLEANFPGVFDEIHFAGIWDKIAKDRMSLTKAGRLKQLGADYFIDDQPHHCFAAAQAGINALLFGDYKWNLGLELPKGVTWVKDWPAVLEYFSGR